MAEMEGIKDGAFAQALKNNRDKLNTKFAYARHTYQNLEGEAFKDHLRLTIAPIVEAVNHVAPQSVDDVLIALYDFSLELIGKSMLGAETRYPALLRGWNQIFVQFPHLLAQDPQAFAGAISNALYNLSINQNTRPDFWINEMLSLGWNCSDIQAFLEVGKIVSWRSGMAHYREGALEACMEVDEKLARAALCINDSGDTPVKVIVENLQKDPWLAPWAASQEGQHNKRLKIASIVGAFRGYGGLFVSPPEVFLSDNEIYVFDNEYCWLMTADLFGATLHRVGAYIPEPDKAKRKDFRIDKDGQVSRSDFLMRFLELAAPTSSAANDTTLAVTIPHSFGVYLVALTEN
jgi:hypothetical protein